MEFINMKVPFRDRLRQQLLLGAIVELGIIILMVYITWGVPILVITVMVAFLPTSIYSYLRTYKECINWIELFTVDEDAQICTLRLMQKDELFKELQIPVSRISCKLIAEPRGTSGGRYKLRIFNDGQFLFEQCDIIINRYKLQEILRYFHPDAYMAKKKKL